MMGQAVPMVRSDAERPGAADPRTVELLEGFEADQSALAEVDPRRARVLGYGAAVAAVAVLAGLVAAWFGDRVESASPEAVVPTTTSPTPAADDSPVTTLPPAVPRPEQGQGRGVADLPGARPAAVLTALTADGDLFRLDVISGWWDVVDVGTSLSQLFDLDGVLLARSGRRLLRVDPDGGTVVEVAAGSTEMLRAHGPAAVVMVERDDNGVVARILGPDGVFRGGSRLPGEAVVHGAVNDRLVATLAGQVVLVGDDEAEVLGTGRVVGLGPSTVVRVECDLAVDPSCRLVSTDLGGGIRHVIAVPELLDGVSPQRWDQVGELSPDGRRLVLPLVHGNGSIRGLVAVDLVTGEAWHSPELGVDLGEAAWAPDGNFVVYPFERDLMVWALDSPSRVVTSGRVIVRQQLSEVTLR